MTIDTKSENFWAACLVAFAVLCVTALFFLRAGGDIVESAQKNVNKAPDVRNEALLIPSSKTVPFLEKRPDAGEPK